MVRSVLDVLEQIKPALRARTALLGRTITSGDPSEPDSVAAGRVLELLAAGAVAVDELIRGSGRSANEILACVLDLELRGVIRQLPGRQFQLTGRFAGVGGLQ